MGTLAIIGGTGLTAIEGLEQRERMAIDTPYGPPSAELVIGAIGGGEVVFLARHGSPHRFPPHKVNYRANIWALREAGVDRIIAVAAVGGIRADMAPGCVAIPDQIIDYTYGRRHTYFDEGLDEVVHIDFTAPYSAALRAGLLDAGSTADIPVIDGGTYGATQGPRLETAAEILRMERDGCALVGMTGMPEAALARELGLDYACCAVIANWAAGKSPGEITMAEIETNLREGMRSVRAILRELVRNLPTG